MLTESQDFEAARIDKMHAKLVKLLEAQEKLCADASADQEETIKAVKALQKQDAIGLVRTFVKVSPNSWRPFLIAQCMEQDG